jgi:electron transfer flavoprotein beta subunit
VSTTTGIVVACLKWVDRRPEIDPLSGAVRVDERTSGASPADESALEWALRAGETWGHRVVAVTAGPPNADGVLRDALARGAAGAWRVELPASADSDAVAGALALAVTAAADEAGGAPVALVCCGDHSLDRGSGAVPAFLAGRLGAAQALGLLALELDGPGRIRGVRRLDGGRREQLHAGAPVVVSVEGGTAPLRRASVAATLAARAATTHVLAGPAAVAHEHRPLRPYRPRPRVLAPPGGDTALARVRALTSSGPGGGTGGRAQPVPVTPEEAADRILDALAEWGEAPQR